MVCEREERSARPSTTYDQHIFSIFLSFDLISISWNYIFSTIQFRIAFWWLGCELQRKLLWKFEYIFVINKISTERYTRSSHISILFRDYSRLVWSWFGMDAVQGDVFEIWPAVFIDIHKLVRWSIAGIHPDPWSYRRQLHSGEFPHRISDEITLKIHREIES